MIILAGVISAVMFMAGTIGLIITAGNPISGGHKPREMSICIIVLFLSPMPVTLVEEPFHNEFKVRKSNLMFFKNGIIDLVSIRHWKCEDDEVHFYTGEDFYNSFKVRMRCAEMQTEYLEYLKEGGQK